MEPHQKRMHQQHTVIILRHWVTLKVLLLLLEVGTNPTIEPKYLILQIINGQRLLITHIIKCKYQLSCSMSHHVIHMWHVFRAYVSNPTEGSIVAPGRELVD